MTHGRLFVVPVCPPRRRAASRYGSAPAATLLGPVIEHRDLMRWASMIVPQILERARREGGHVRVVMGDVEGVMDVFNRRESQGNDAEYRTLHTALRKRNIELAAELLTAFVDHAVVGELGDLANPIPVADRCTVASLSAAAIPISTVPAPLARGHELVDYFESRPVPAVLMDEYEHAVSSLRRKCPFFTEDEVQIQAKRVRYAERRAVATLARAWAAELGLAEPVVVTFREDPLDVFHVDAADVAVPILAAVDNQDPLTDVSEAEIALATLFMSDLRPSSFAGTPRTLAERVHGRRRDLKSALRSMLVTYPSPSSPDRASAVGGPGPSAGRVVVLPPSHIDDPQLLAVLAAAPNVVGVVGRASSGVWSIGAGQSGPCVRLGTSERRAARAAGLDPAEARETPRSARWWIDGLRANRPALSRLHDSASGAGDRRAHQLPWEAIDLAALTIAGRQLFDDVEVWDPTSELRSYTPRLGGLSLTEELRAALMVADDRLMMPLSPAHPDLHPLVRKAEAVDLLIRRVEPNEAEVKV